VVQGELLFVKGCRDSKGVCVFDSKGRKAAGVLAFWLFGFLVRSQKARGRAFRLRGLAFWLFGSTPKKQKSSASWRGAAGSGFLASKPKHQKAKKPKSQRHRGSARLFGFSAFWLFGLRLFGFLALGPGGPTPKSRGASPQSQQPGFLALELSGLRGTIRTTYGKFIR